VSGPIIVTGPDRSGTTLMYSLLASHPDVSMVRRTNLWRWFRGRFGDLSVPANLDRCLDTMVRYQRLEVLEINPQHVKDELRGGPITYGRLFRLVHEQHARRHSKPRWGDKSLHHEHHADQVLADLPDATIIHLLRDPRDRHASVVKRYGTTDRSRAGITARWLSSTRAGERNATRHPDRYLLVRFEDLARHPEATVRVVCDAVDLDYDPAMLGLGGAADAPADDAGNSSFERIAPGTISTRPIGRFRTVLEPDDIAAIQALAGRAMRRHGYDPEPIPMDGRHRVAFAGALLGDTVQLGAALARSKVEHRTATVPAQRLRAGAVR
jgi:hypothetical protein